MAFNEKNPPPPLCVWCSAPWTDDMLKVYAEADDDFGYYPGEYTLTAIDTVIDVTCKSCGKLVYRKEVRVPKGWWEKDKKKRDYGTPE